MDLTSKWRPSKFEDVVGQDQATRILKEAARRGRWEGAYLLQGSRGTGKTTCARILAQATRCTNIDEGEPCGTCQTCEQPDGVTKGWLELDAASNRTTESAREIREMIEETVAEGQGCTYVIDEAHMLTAGARTIVQDLIEDEKPKVTLILCTTEAHEIPESLRTRCQEHRFRRLRNAEIAAHLRRICESEGYPADEGALGLIAHGAEGGMRDAIRILEHVATVDGGTISAETVGAVLGTHLRQTILGMTRHLLAGNETGAIIGARMALEEGAEPRQVHREATARLIEALGVAWDLKAADDIPQTSRAALRNTNWRTAGQMLWRWAEERPRADEGGGSALERTIAKICERPPED